MVLFNLVFIRFEIFFFNLPDETHCKLTSSGVIVGFSRSMSIKGHVTLLAGPSTYSGPTAVVVIS